jgi:hypothetical protein
MYENGHKCSDLLQYEQVQGTDKYFKYLANKILHGLAPFMLRSV